MVTSRESGVREDLLVGRHLAALGEIVDNHGRLILIDRDHQLVAARTLVVRLDGEARAQSPLDAEVELIDVGGAQIGIDGAQSDHAAGGMSGALVAEVRNKRHALVEPDRPRKFARLRHAGGLIRGQVVGRVQAHVGGNVVERFVVADTEARADHRVVVAEESVREARRVGHANHGCEIVFVRGHAAVAERRTAPAYRTNAAAPFFAGSMFST